MTAPDRRHPFARLLTSVVVALTLVGLVALELHAAWSLSLTVDEPIHLGAGLDAVSCGAVGPTTGHGPLAQLLAGGTLRALGVREGRAVELHKDRSHPDSLHLWVYGQRVLFDENPRFKVPFALPGPQSVLVAARAPLVLFPLLAAAVAYAWGKRRFGVRGGLVALALVASYPDLLGGGMLVMTDAPLAAVALACAFVFERLVTRGGLGALAAFGALSGALLATKATGLFALAGLALAAGAALAWPLDPAPASVAHPFGSGTARARAVAVAGAFAVVLALASAVVCLAYLGENPVGALLRTIRGVYGTMAPDLRGICLGRVVKIGDFWYPFPVLLLKLPLGTLLLLALAAVVAWRDRGPLASELTLLAPGLAMLLAIAFLAAPFGGRYLIACVPFFLVAAGRLGPWTRGSSWRAAVVALALVANLAGTWLDHPFHLSATNPLAGPRRLAWRWLDNSSTDLGGGLLALGDWQRARRIERLVVVPYSGAPYSIRDDGSVKLSVVSWLGVLDAWGVSGETRLGDVLFQPERGRVYAVSANDLAWARVIDREARERGVRLPPLVLGGSTLPGELVGGFAIFDLRDGLR